MAKTRLVIMRKSQKWHSWLGWTGGIALLIFAISGISHPVMTWTGPKAASFFPPQVKISIEMVKKIPSILARHKIEQSIMAKIIPSKSGPLLQITQAEAQPRRYFDLKSETELKNYDQTHAIWLARYYTGLKTAPIKSIHFQTKFDNAYPWVNRLLPVYRVNFDTKDNRKAFIYTELGALAGHTNNWKTSIQTIFKALHTWTWLNDFEYARIFLMVLLLLSLLGMAITGTLLVFLIKKRSIPDGKRKWHRMLSFAVWIPLLFFSASGIYHLLQYSFGENHRGLKLGSPIDLQTNRFGQNYDWLSQFKNTALNSLSIVESPTTKGAPARLLYRISIPKGKAGQSISKKTRFKGMAKEKQAFYFDALTGKKSAFNDKAMALSIAETNFGFPKDTLLKAQLITHFGPHYDFRNKRLPVWQLDYKTEQGDKLFIDAATGMLVDRLVNIERYEGYSFSFLHKWNFLSPFIGRMNRDIIIVLLLLLSIVLTIIGYIMLLKKKSKSQARNKHKIQISTALSLQNGPCE